MKYKGIIIIIAMVLSNYCNAQMFEYLDYLDKSKISDSAIAVQVDYLYDDAETKIKELVIWELSQVQRVQKEIEFESKDLPENKIEDLKYQKFAELEQLITVKEIELDFWYLEELDKLNDYAEDNNISCTFLPETQIQGRIIKMVIKHLMVDQNKYNQYKDNLDYATTAASVGSFALPGIGNAAILVVEVGAMGINEVTSRVIEDIIENYSKYFGLGMMTNAREVQLTKIQNAKL